MSSRLTAMDVAKQDFPRKVRGFAVEDVRIFLQSVAEEIARLNLENGELSEELGRLKREAEQYRGRESTLQQTLISAQRMTDDMKEKGRVEADLVVKQARLEAERVLQEAQDQLVLLEDEISRRKLERDLFQRRLRGLIDEHSSLLERRAEPGGESDDNVRFLPPRSGSEAG